MLFNVINEKGLADYNFALFRRSVGAARRCLPPLHIPASGTLNASGGPISVSASAASCRGCACAA
jgi:hypothetical protein